MPPRTRTRARRPLVSLLEAIEPRVLLTTYYISPTGSDAAAGTSQGTAWKTIAKANTLNLDPGDQLLFQGGATFNLPVGQNSSTLTLDASDSGNSANPVTIGSYGSGRATLVAGTGSGIIATNVAGLVIQDLILTGTWNGLAGTGTNTGKGILLYNDLAANAKINFTRLNNLDISGFKFGGISSASAQAKSGFTDLRITNSAAHDNGDYGIDIEGAFSASSTQYANSNVYIGYCKAYNNGGLAGKSNHSGDGILLGDTDGGTIERCVAWNNGQNCNYASGGPVGIWAWDSNNITIQLNESYSNKTGASSLDGGGFDLDGGVTNSVLQYNYSHDNDGAGYLLYQFSGARPFGNNTVRYNISQNDARQGHYAGIYMGGGSAITNTQVYGNTIYMTPTGDTSIAAIKFTGVGTGNKFRNNIFYTTGTVALLNANVNYTTASVLFQGNDWYNSTGAKFTWGGTTYTSLSAWRTASGQEVLSGNNVGTSANPNLVAPGTGGTLGDATALSTLTAYQLTAASPLINAGVNLTSLGVSAGSRDFYGGGNFVGGTFDIGAHEFSASTSGTSSNDAFILRLGATGNIELFINTPTSAAPTMSWTPASYTAQTFDGGGGTDTFTLDLTNGNPLASAGATFVGGVDPDHLIITGSTNADTVTLNSSSVQPGATGGSLSFSGVGDIVANTLGGNDTLTVGSSGIAASASINLGSGNDTLAINSGSYFFNVDGASLSPNLAVSVAAGASVRFNAAQHLAALTISGNASIASGHDKAVVTKALTINPGGKFDIADNTVIVDYTGTSPIGTWNGSAYTGLTGQIVSGRNGGAWNGAGINSSFAATRGWRVTLGISEATDALGIPTNGTGTYLTQPVDGTCVFIRYGLAGDANLSMSMTGDDYYLIDSNYLAGFKSYARGDFDYNGKLNADDYFLLDSNYGHYAFEFGLA